MAKPRILFIDDEKDFTSVVRLNLEEIGRYEVEVENSSKMGLQAALRFKPDLIFLDVIMPGKEGPDVLYDLRGQEELKDTPVVFLTATVTKEEVDDQKGEIGGHRFMAKPGSLEELLDCIDDYV